MLRVRGREREERKEGRGKETERIEDMNEKGMVRGSENGWVARGRG